MPCFSEIILEEFDGKADATPENLSVVDSQRPAEQACVAMKSGCSVWENYSQMFKQKRCPYQGLQHMSEEEQDEVVTGRLGTLSLYLHTHGGTSSMFTELVNVYDSFGPGELGHIHHSKFFHEICGEAFINEAEKQQTLAIHELLPALKLPSDYKRATGSSCFSWSATTKSFKIIVEIASMFVGCFLKQQPKDVSISF